MLGILAIALPLASGATYVFDEANILHEEVVQSLDGLINSWSQKTSHQMAIVTVKSLEGSSIEEYAVRRFQKMGIGRKDKNDGLLLLVAPNDRKLRIEVGYGLEGYLPDGVVGSLRDRYMIPLFKQGAFEKGILVGTLALLQTQAKQEGIEWTPEISVSASLPKHSSRNTQNVDLLFGILFFVVILLLLGRSQRGGLGGWLPWLILASLSSSDRGRHGGFGGFGGGFGGFGGGSSGGGGASGSW